MPRDLQTITIDGESYQMSYLVTSDSLKVAALVGKRLLPSVGKVLSGLGALNDAKGLLEKDLSELKLDAALATLAETLDPEEINQLIQKLCSVVMVPGLGILNPQNFEEHFKGRPGHALKVAAASFEVNCKDFFGAAVSGVFKAMGSIQAQVK